MADDRDAEAPARLIEEIKSEGTESERGNTVREYLNLLESRTVGVEQGVYELIVRVLTGQAWSRFSAFSALDAHYARTKGERIDEFMTAAGADVNFGYRPRRSSGGPGRPPGNLSENQERSVDAVPLIEWSAAHSSPLARAF